MTLSWEITTDNRLLFEGVDHTTAHAWTKREIAESLQLMLRQIAVSGHQIVIEAILIDLEVATGLFNEGSLTEDMLRTATDSVGWITVVMEFSGIEYFVAIEKSLVHAFYEFYIDGHPQGIRRVRDSLGIT